MIITNTSESESHCLFGGDVDPPGAFEEAMGGAYAYARADVDSTVENAFSLGVSASTNLFGGASPGDLGKAFFQPSAYSHASIDTLVAASGPVRPGVVKIFYGVPLGSSVAPSLLINNEVISQSISGQIMHVLLGGSIPVTMSLTLHRAPLPHFGYDFQLAAGGALIQFYESDGETPVAISVPSTSVPEPGTATLICAGILIACLAVNGKRLSR